jgi:hypothetical protein
MSRSNSYFPFYPNDHLNDLNLMGCHAAAQGVWWSMVCLMAQGSPFGHLRIEPGENKLFLQPKNANPQGEPIGGPIGGPIGQPIGGPTKKRQATLSLEFEGGLSRNEFRLSSTGSLEADLARIIRQPPDLVAWALAHLEHRGVFSRTDQGIIYCRRMVNDEKRRAQQAKYAKEGYEKRQRDKATGKAPEGRSQSRSHIGGPIGEPIGGPIGQPRPNGKTTNTNTNPKYKRTPTPQPPAPRGRGLSDEQIEQAVKQRRAGK